MKVFVRLLILFVLGACSSEKNLWPFKKRVKNSTPKIQTPLIAGPTDEKQHRGFVDKTDTVGLSGLSASALYAVDINLDGYTDLIYLDGFYDRPKFMLWNQSEKKFQAHDLLGDLKVEASFLVFADFNKDGKWDFLSGVLNQKGELTPRPLRLFYGKFHNSKVSFLEDEKAFLGLPADSVSGVTVFDFNHDGRLDLFISSWYDFTKKKPIPRPDRLLVGEKKGFSDGSFHLRGEWLKEDKEYVNATPSFGATLCDIDQNGYADLLVPAQDGHNNKLWLNRPQENGPTFWDYGKESGFANDQVGALLKQGGGHSFFANCIDYNNNGFMDIYLGEQTVFHDGEERDVSSILTNSGKPFPPRFLRTPYTRPMEQTSWAQSDRRALWGDFNNDGLWDLVVVNTGYPPQTRMILFKQLQDHAFEEVSLTTGIDILNPYATISLDVNQDGLLDLLTAQINVRDQRIKPRLYYFENQWGDQTNSRVRLYLRGRWANRNVLGGHITFVTNKKTRKVMYDFSQGALPSQNEEGIIFSLHPEEILQEVMVSFPVDYQQKTVKRSYKISLKKKLYQEWTLWDTGDISQGRPKFFKN